MLTRGQQLFLGGVGAVLLVLTTLVAAASLSEAAGVHSASPHGGADCASCHPDQLTGHP